MTKLPDKHTRCAGCDQIRAGADWVLTHACGFEVRKVERDVLRFQAAR